MVLSAIHIVIEERNDHSNQTCDEHTIYKQSLALEAIEETDERQYGETAGESVDAVNQVECVVDKHYDKHSQRRTDTERYRLNAHETIEVVDVQTRERHKACSQYLNKKFHTRRYSYNIVNKTDGVNQYYADKEHERPKAYGESLVVVEAIDSYRQQRSHYHTRHEARSTHTRDVNGMNLTEVRHIIKFLFLAKICYLRYREDTANETHQKGGYYKSYSSNHIICIF